jgi:hypothetical protein
MWLSVPSSLYAPKVHEVIRDGNRLGNGSTFYSITASGDRKEDYYGFEWDQPQTIGLLGYHGGSVEENGGWFTSLRVEYRDTQGEWKPVGGLLISPPLAPENEPYNDGEMLAQERRHRIPVRSRPEPQCLGERCVVEGKFVSHVGCPPSATAVASRRHGAPRE